MRERAKREATCEDDGWRDIKEEVLLISCNVRTALLAQKTTEFAGICRSVTFFKYTAQFLLLDPLLGPANVSYRQK